MKKTKFLSVAALALAFGLASCGGPAGGPRGGDVRRQDRGERPRAGAYFFAPASLHPGAAGGGAGTGGEQPPSGDDPGAGARSGGLPRRLPFLHPVRCAQW